MDLAAPVPSRFRYAPRTRPARRILAVLAALVPLLLVATPATAAPAGSTAESATAAVTQPATPGRDCVLAAGAGARLHCFAGFPAAISYATGGRITDAPATAAAAAGDKAFAAKVTAANTAANTAGAVTAAATALLGVEYADANLRGSSLTLTGAGAGCDNSGDVDYRFASMPSGWNDRITSFTSFSNCVQQLFRNTNFGGGALTLPIRTLSNVGSAANDQASSLTFN